MKKLTVGLTGGLAAGKSEALREFARLGAKVVSLDAIAHLLSRKGGRAHAAIAEAFGPSALDARGGIDRRALARLVFSNAAARRKLEKITHPLILDAMLRRMAAARRGLCVVDVPLLFEKGLSGVFDATVMVSSSLRRRLERAAKRDGLRPAEIKRRMSAQWPQAAKEKFADVVIRNDGELADLKNAVRGYFRACELIYGGT